jgi:hypothetical protein
VVEKESSLGLLWVVHYYPVAVETVTPLAQSCSKAWSKGSTKVTAPALTMLLSGNAPELVAGDHSLNAIRESSGDRGRHERVKRLEVQVGP